MMKRRPLLRRVLIAGVAATMITAAILLPARRAQCALCGGVEDYIIAPVVVAMHLLTQFVVSTAIVSRLALFEYLLVDALIKHAGQTMGSLYGSSMLTASNISALNSYRVIIERQVNAVHVHRDMIPSDVLCQGVSGSRGLKSARDTTWFFTKGIDYFNVQRSAKALPVPDPGTVKTFHSNDLPESGSRLAALEDRYSNRMKNYCDQEEAGEDECPRRDPAIGVNADVLVGPTFLSANTFTPKQEKAAYDLILNLTDPLPPDPLPPSILTEPRGQELHIKRKALEAKMQMAQTALTKMAGERLPTTNMGKWAELILDEFEGEKDFEGGAISEHQLYEILLSRRFENPITYIRMTGSEFGAAQREIALMTAMSLMLQWKQYELLEHLLGVRATSLAMKVEKAREDEADDDTTPSAVARP